MSPPPVSAVIPTRDRAASLERAVASVLSQGRALAEVVVVDDGSSPAVRCSGVLGDERVRLLRNTRSRGPAAARNQGAAECSSPLIAFLDDDDRWLAGKISASLACLMEHPEAVMVEHLPRSRAGGIRDRVGRG